MKKVSILFSLSAALLVAATGCLKDKGFEDQQYGIQIADQKGVAFPQASSSPLTIALDRQTDPQTIDGPLISLEQTGNAGSNVTVTLAIDDALVVAEGLTPLPSSAYTISTLTPVIEAGKQNVSNITLSILNAFVLDPTESYGIGVKISQVDQGYKIAENQKSLVIKLVIKNPYAAEYTVTGYFFHPTAPREIDDIKDLATISSTVVRAPHSDLYGSNYFFDFEVDDVTYALKGYVARGAVPNGAQSGFMTQDVPYSGAFAPLAPGTAPWVHSTYSNTYDPASKTFWMQYGYAVGASSQTAYTRQVYEKWVRN